MKKVVFFLAVLTAVITSSCGTNPTPTTERQYQDRIMFLEYQKHTREQEIIRLQHKLKNCRQ